MVLSPRIRLSESEKDALLLEQAALIGRLAARITELEAMLGKPRKTSSNSHLPPSKDGPGRGDRPKRPRKKRPSRPGKSRPLTETPDKTERRMASECGHCGMDVSGARQRCRQRYDHIELPIIRPVVTRVELFGGRCGGCGHRYKAQAPETIAPGSPFGPGIRSLLMYLITASCRLAAVAHGAQCWADDLERHRQRVPPGGRGLATASGRSRKLVTARSSRRTSHHRLTA